MPAVHLWTIDRGACHNDTREGRTLLRLAISWIAGRLRLETGQDLIEYALLGGLIAAALIAVAALPGLTTAVTSMANGVGECIDWDGVDCTP